MNDDVNAPVQPEVTQAPQVGADQDEQVQNGGQDGTQLNPESAVEEKKTVEQAPVELEVQSPVVPEEPTVVHHVDTDPSFNCPTCLGDGLLSPVKVCENCQGTGKVS